LIFYFTLAAAQELKKSSPQAVFHYVSGQGTSLDSRFMWARVKAQTEQELIKMMNAVGWRPAFIGGVASAGSPKLFKPFSSFYVEGQDLGRAMTRATIENIHGGVIENAEIRRIAGRYGSLSR
jgi:hypothetical protein